MALVLLVLSGAGELELNPSTTGAGIPKWAILLVEAITSESVSK